MLHFLIVPKQFHQLGPDVQTYEPVGTILTHTTRTRAAQALLRRLQGIKQLQELMGNGGRQVEILRKRRNVRGKLQLKGRVALMELLSELLRHMNKATKLLKYVNK